MFSLKGILTLLVVSIVITGCNVKDFNPKYDISKNYDVVNSKDFPRDFDADVQKTSTKEVQ